MQDLKDFVPKSVLGVENEEGVEAAMSGDKQESEDEEKQKERIEREKEEVRKLEEELEGLKLSEGKEGAVPNGNVVDNAEAEAEEGHDDDDE